MTMEKKSKGCRGFLGRTVIVLVGAVLAFEGGVQIVAWRRWAAMEQRVVQITRELEAADAARPVLRGEPLTGCAWQHYGAAFDKLFEAGYPGLGYTLAKALEDRTPAGMAELHAFVAKHQEILEHVKQGVRRSILGRKREEIKPFHYGPSTHSPAQVIALLMIAHARLLENSGCGREAAEVLLDLQVFARDVGYPQAGGLGIISQALDELRPILESIQLTKDDFAEIARQLEIVDREFPSYILDLKSMVLLTGRELVTYGDWGSYMVSIGTRRESSRGQYSWRYAFSKRLTCASSFHWLDRWAQRFSEGDPMPWPQMISLRREFVHDHEPWGKRVAQDMAITMAYSGDCYRRQTLAKARLLRIAAHYRATGKLLELDDPFGSKLLSTEAGGRLKSWSIGPTSGGEIRNDWLCEQGIVNVPERDFVIEAEWKK